MNDILTVSGLNKSYGDFSLKDVTFSLPEGCITGFISILRIIVSLIVAAICIAAAIFNLV